MNFASPHRKNPVDVLLGQADAPALLVHVDTDDGVVATTSTHVQITVGGQLVNINYVGKSLEDVAADISSSDRSIVASALNTRFQLVADELYMGTLPSADGGSIVRMKGHTVRYTAETRIRSLHPYNESRFLPWYPRVDRGNIVVRKNGIRYIFAVPEYEDQVWSTHYGAPFVDQRGIRPERVSAKVLKLPRTPVFWDERNIFLSVDGNMLGPSIIEDVDTHNGLVYLSVPIPQEGNLVVNYTYLERTYVYKRINLNPSVEHNPNVIDRAIVLYLLPAESSSGRSRSITVHHVTGQTIKGAMESISPGEEPILVIGAYHVRPMGGVMDIEHRDTRDRGGGIDTQQYDQALKKNQEVYSVSDSGRWDGIPFPAAASGVLLLPRELLETYSEDFIQEQVNRHLAIGGNIILDFSDDLNLG